jgi:aryl-alcohol dehydrogenase-like predicted oxidoreductase
MVTRPAFGALPLQRLSMAEADLLLKQAVDAGINFIDTARAYTDSEEKIGLSLHDRRHSLIIATKSQGKTGGAILADLHVSLKHLRTDYVDILQLHNANHVPTPGDGSGSYEALLEARAAGKIRFIGITNHSVDSAVRAIRSDLYATVQFPFSLLSSGLDLELPGMCRERDIGFIAMKALAGGLITDVPATAAFIDTFANVVPIWGLQRPKELEQFLALAASPLSWDDEMEKRAAHERAQFGSSFCRGCGYCLPCPMEIDIPFAARVMLMLMRAPASLTLTDNAKARMVKARECIQCGECKTRCPYHLDTPTMVRENAEAYAVCLASAPSEGASGAAHP